MEEDDGRSSRVQEKMRDLECYLYEHRDALFRQKRQHRSTNTFQFSGGSFQLGVGSTHSTFLKQVGSLPGFIKHNFKNTGVCVTPVAERKVSPHRKVAYALAMEILRLMDPEYAAGETLVQFAHMCQQDDRVDRHVDKEDISHQYALSLGQYEGATLRAYDAQHTPHDLDNRWRIARFDGRLPHEVVCANFWGDRFTVIWYKNYDSRKTKADPILDTPTLIALPASSIGTSAPPPPAPVAKDLTGRKRARTGEDDCGNVRFFIGKRIELRDLTNRAEFNGRTGTVLGARDGRMVVRLEDDHLISLKPTTLEKAIVYLEE